MQLQFKLVIGKNEFTLSETVNSHKEFFQKVSFYTLLPKVGPNGETDLELMFRTTKQGHTYYSIVSPSAKKEYAFGQSQKNPGELFGKGWQDVYQAGADEDDQGQQNSGGGFQAPQNNGASAAPTGNVPPQAAPATSGFQAPQAAPAVQSYGPPAGVQNNIPPKVQAQANDVLAKFLGK